ncbi:MAG: B12-binding domain-containing radical SAM protein [Rhodospirillales bacterium]|nr:B12-binding domain-containing radical SAM protein [Rhodospirillales bacterium]
MFSLRQDDANVAERTDLLLVTPPSRARVYQGLSTDYAAIEPPVWSGLIAEYVRRHGYSVRMLDAEALQIGFEDTARRIVETDAALTVYVIYGQQPSASTQCMPAGRAVAGLVARESDRPSLVMGTHASALPERTLREEPYTYVCQGEGPLTVTGLLEVLAGKRDLTGVPGLWYRDGGTIRHTAPAARLGDLDAELPRQAWDLLDMSRYRAHNWQALGDLDNRARYASVQTSLGCPYKCSFCCINAPFGGSGIRYWSPDAVMAQIDELVGRHNVRFIKIPDEMFVLNKNHVLGLCDRLIERGYDLNIWAYARIDTVQPIFLDRLSKAGFRWLGLGIESASKHVRDGVTKGRFGDADIARTVAAIRDAGIHVSANYIFGLPDDTWESMRETLDMALRLNTEWANFYSAMAYPGSALYPLAKEKGWRLPDDPGGPGWIGYSQHARDCLPLPTEALSAGEVLAFRDHAFDTYFASEPYLSMIENTFGPCAMRHLREMASHRLERSFAAPLPSARHPAALAP